MGKVRIRCISRRDADDKFEAVEESVSLHFPGSTVNEHNRIVTVTCADPRDVCDTLISDGAIDPEEDDYEVQE